MPPGLYRVSRASIARGAIVLACLPSDVSAFARSRGYVPSGSCEDGTAPVGKVVVALPGDTVDVSLRGVAVNGRVITNTAPLSMDSRGRQLPRLSTGRRLVAEQEVWVLSSYSKRSFDSRYFGSIASSSIVARVIPLLVKDGRGKP